MKHTIRARTARPLGVILYEGPSRIDGKPIVLIATFETSNRKTGNMIQTWILRRFVSPVAAINNGGDVSICGSCPLRGIVQRGTNRMRGCYVKVSNAPRAVWGAYRRGRYPKYDPKQHGRYFAGRALRLGAYGDPVAVPLRVWKPLLRVASNHTGYSHQWRDNRFSRWSKYIMASTHSTAENLQAGALGWRTFRTRNPDSAIADNEIVCPASDEGGKRLTCESCGACKGGRPTQRSIVIIGHGSPAVLAGVKRISA